MNRNTLSSFLFRNSVLIFLSFFVLTAIYSISIVRTQVEMAVYLISQKIEKVIEFNKNELLDEIALSDKPALAEHANILARELGVDYVEIHSGTVHIRSEAFSRRRPNWIERAFLSILKIPALSRRVSNDYGNFPATLNFEFSDSIYQSTVLPVLSHVYVTKFGVVFLSILILAIAFIKIRRRLIEPIQELVEHFKTVDRHATGVLPLAPLPQDALAEVRLLYDAFRQYEELRDKAVIDEIGRQVSHDIRSPLMALQLISADLEGLSAEKRALLRNAVLRIQEIASSLTKTTESKPRLRPEDAKGSFHITTLVEAIVSEKRVQIGKRTHVALELVIEADAFSLFASVPPAELSRVLSNLIDNALEAIRNVGRVEIRVSATPAHVEIEIRDNGHGIPGSILSVLMRKGATFGKPGGTGLGLYHAKKVVEAWDGKIEIQSVVGSGTRVTLTIPRVDPPEWFAHAIHLRHGRSLVILDDDQTVHDVWTAVLNRRGLSLSHVHFFSRSQELIHWLQTHSKQEAVFLVDYDLGADTDGLSLIQKLNLGEQSVLVTNRSEDPELREASLRQRVPLLPKTLIGDVPFITEDVV